MPCIAGLLMNWLACKAMGPRLSHRYNSHHAHQVGVVEERTEIETARACSGSTWRLYSRVSKQVAASDADLWACGLALGNQLLVSGVSTYR